MCRARWSDLEKHLQDQSASERLDLQSLLDYRSPTLYTPYLALFKGKLAIHRITQFIFWVRKFQLLEIDIKVSIQQAL